MKKRFLYLLVLPLIFSACQSECPQASGTISHRGVQLKPFDQISLEGPLKLVLNQDSSFMVRTQADSNAVELVKIKVNGQKLVVSLRPDAYCGTDTIVVHAGIGDLKKLEIGKASRVETASRISVNNLELKTTDANSVDLELNAGKLVTTTDGSADIRLSGQAGTHQLKSKGSLNLEAFNFITGIYDLNIDGMGKLKINVLNELKVKTSGASEIYYKGNPAKVEEKKSGTSRLEKVN